MKPIVIVLLTAALAASGPAQDARTHTVTLEKLAVGDVIVEGMKADAEVHQTTIMGDEPPIEESQKLSSKVKLRWTVLALDEKGVSSVRLQVIEHVDMYDDDAKEQADSGKTFVLTRGESGLDIAVEGDFVVDESMEREVRRAVHDEAGALINPSAGLSALIARGKFTEGTAIEVPGSEIPNFIGSFTEDMPLESIKFTPKEERMSLGSPCLVFELETEVVDESPGSSQRLDMTGEVVVRKSDGWVQSLTFSGPMTMTAEHEGVRVTGSGRLDMKLLSFFEKKKKAEKK